MISLCVCVCDELPILVSISLFRLRNHFEFNQVFLEEGDILCKSLFIHMVSARHITHVGKFTQLQRGRCLCQLLLFHYSKHLYLFSLSLYQDLIFVFIIRRRDGDQHDLERERDQKRRFIFIVTISIIFGAGKGGLYYDVIKQRKERLSILY